MDPVKPALPQPALQDLNTPEDRKQLARASREFEAYFIQELLQEMRKSIPKSSQPGFGSAIYESMIDQALAQKMSEGPGIGLASQLIEKLQSRE
jgi:flagellar protein FlgJ